MGQPPDRSVPERRVRVASLWLLATVGALTAAHAAAMLAPTGAFKTFGTDWLYYAVLAAAGIAVVVRVVLVDKDRLPWALIAGIGVCSSVAADIVYALLYADMKHAPYPSIADALWLAYYPFVAAGALILARRVVGRVGVSLALDGAIAAAGAAAIGAALLGPSLVGYAHAKPIELAVNLAYPIGDMLLLGGIAAAAVLVGWRRDFVVLGLGLLTVVVTDTIYVQQEAASGYVGGTFLDAGWTISAALIGLAAWQRLRPSVANVAEHQARSIMLPVLIALTAVGLTTIDHYSRVTDVSLILASVTLLLVLIRLVLAFAENGRLLGTARLHAMTDALTGMAETAPAAWTTSIWAVREAHKEEARIHRRWDPRPGRLQDL